MAAEGRPRDPTGVTLSLEFVCVGFWSGLLPVDGTLDVRGVLILSQLEEPDDMRLDLSEEEELEDDAEREGRLT